MPVLFAYKRGEFMNVYIVTWVDAYNRVRADYVEAYDCAAACYGVCCDVHDVISVMRVYDGVLVK